MWSLKVKNLKSLNNFFPYIKKIIRILVLTLFRNGYLMVLRVEMGLQDWFTGQVNLASFTSRQIVISNSTV